MIKKGLTLILTNTFDTKLPVYPASLVLRSQCVKWYQCCQIALLNYYIDV